MQHKSIFILLFLLFIVSLGCQKQLKECKSAENSEVYFCKIYQTSNDNYSNFFDTKIWKSSNPAIDDIVIFAFYRPVFVQKITIEQAQTKDFAKIKTICVYTDKGKLGQFAPENIKIADIVSFVIVRISGVSQLTTTFAYSEQQKYALVFDFLNKSWSIKQINFWKNDSTRLDLCIDRDFYKNPSKLNYLDKKIVDFSEREKTIYFKNNGKLIGFVSDSEADTIFFGKYFFNTKKIELNKYIFSENHYQKKHIKSSFNIVGNVLKIKMLDDFRFDFEDSFLVDVKTLDTSIVEDMRYATDNNFTHKQIYNCPACLMRYKAAKDFVKAEKEFLTMGYRIKVFDCYRPHSAQYKLWEVVPNINYVANPSKGSIHNRGAAVDMTLVDSCGKQIDMGTPFDYFGYAAYSINEDLPDDVLYNRKLMWTVMHKHGFNVIKTEWWHLSHYSCLQYSIVDIPLPCE